MKEKLFKVVLHRMWANAQKRSFNTPVETIITGDLPTCGYGEMADAPDSGSGGRNPLQVQLLLSAPINILLDFGVNLCLLKRLKNI